MTGYDDGPGIRRPAPLRFFSANVDLLPTEEHPALLTDFTMPMWTDLPLHEFIEQMEQDFTCVINWLFEIPEPKEHTRAHPTV